MTCDAVWQMLQIEGWSDPQLRLVQGELTKIELLAPLPRCYELERIVYLDSLEKHRQVGLLHFHSTPITGSSPLWKQRLYAMHWSCFRVSQLRTDAIRRHQGRIDLHRGLAAGIPAGHMPDEEPVLTFSDFDTRFENWIAASGPPMALCSACTPLYPTTAIWTELTIEAKRRLAIIAVGLERHRLLSGGYPTDLRVLVPHFLEQVWVSPESGKRPRYRLTSRERFELTFRPRHFINVADWPSADSACFVGWSPDDAIPPVVIIDEAPLAEVIEELAAMVKIKLEFSIGLRSELESPFAVHIQGATARLVLKAVLVSHELSSHYDAANDRFIIARSP